MPHLFGNTQPQPAIAAQQGGASPDVRLVPLGGFDANGLPILEPDPGQAARSLNLIDLPLLTANPIIKVQEEVEARAAVAGTGLGLGGGLAFSESPMCGLSAEPLVTTGSLSPNGFESSEESQEASPIMVPCLDENDSPDVMPYAVDAPMMGESIFEFWTDLFRPRPSTTTGTVEETEANIPATKPECREDPNHPLQDAGCPFMGPGAAGRCRSPESINATPKMEAEPQGNADTLRLFLRRLPCMMEPAKVEEEPVHPEVDTMEFRPSDANMKAFENWQKRLPL
jgi:hypothetical protein